MSDTALRTFNGVPVYRLGRCTRSDEGRVGHDYKFRPCRLGPGEYTAVTGPDCLDYMPDGLSIVGLRKVRFSGELVRKFNAQWPGSKLSSARAYWFGFDGDGDLIDTDVPEHSDGNEALALTKDARAWLFEGELPFWL